MEPMQPNATAHTARVGEFQWILQHGICDWTPFSATPWAGRGIRIGLSAAMYWFFLLVGLLFAVIYLFFFLREVPGAAKERLGELEPLPDSLGQWQLDEDSDAARQASSQGQLRETRLWQYDEQSARSSRLVRQVRYRSIASGVVERVEPDEPVKRRRKFE